MSPTLILCLYLYYFSIATVSSIEYDKHQTFPSHEPVPIYDPAQSTTIPSEKLDLITNRSDYQKTQFPTVVYGLPTQINVSVYIQNLGDVSETNANYEAELYITLMWHDYRLNFSNFNENKSDLTYPSEFNKTSYFQLISAEDHEKIWIPTVFFSNSRFSEQPDVLSDNCVIFILHDGTVIYQTRVMLVPSCPMSLQNFPFDSQTCPLVISLFGYYDNQVRLNWAVPTRIKPEINNTDTDGVEAKMNAEVANRMTGFTLGNVKATYVTTDNKTNWHATCSQYRSCLQLKFPLKRRYSFYMVDTFFPSSLITALSWLSFWINTEAIPARVTLCVTTFLTLQATTGNVRNRLPAVAYVRAVDIWLFAMQTLIFLSLLEFIMIHSLAGRKVEMNVPHIFSSFGKFMQKTVSKRDEDAVDRRQIYSNETKEKMTPKERMDENRLQKLKRAKQIDRISRAVFPATFALFAAVYYGKYVV